MPSAPARGVLSMTDLYQQRVREIALSQCRGCDETGDSTGNDVTEETPQAA